MLAMTHADLLVLYICIYATYTVLYLIDSMPFPYLTRPVVYIIYIYEYTINCIYIYLQQYVHNIQESPNSPTHVNLQPARPFVSCAYSGAPWTKLMDSLGETKEFIHISYIYTIVPTKRDRTVYVLSVC
jgi:hypothetical protein